MTNGKNYLGIVALIRTNISEFTIEIVIEIVIENIDTLMSI
jgi:hypothetical protein